LIINRSFTAARRRQWPIVSRCGTLSAILLSLFAGRSWAADDPGATIRLASGETLLGHAGVLRTLAAYNHPPGWLSIGTGVEVFRAGNLLMVGTKHTRFVNSNSIAWAPFKFLEAAFAMHVTSDSSVSPEREEIQVAVGDPELSIKGGWTLPYGISLAGLFDVRFPSGTGFLNAAGSATNFLFSALASWRGEPRLPLAVHLNVGFFVDGSRNLFSDLASLSPAQRFAAQVSSFNRVIIRTAVEYETRYVVPFVQLSLEPFVGANAPGFDRSNSRLSVGLAALPTKGRGLHLLAAVDIGLTGVGKGPLPPLGPGDYAVVIPSWNLVFRASYRFDVFAKPKIVEKRVVVREKAATPPVTLTPVPPLASLSGAVVDEKSGKPVAQALITIEGESISPFVTDERGRFRTAGLPLREYTLSIRSTGYQLSKMTARPNATRPVNITVKLQPRLVVDPGTIRGQIKGVGGGKLGSITILIPELDRQVEATQEGTFSLAVQPGDYTLVISAKGFRTQRKSIRVKEGGTVILNIDLHR
jgi:hypothetical protein